MTERRFTDLNEGFVCVHCGQTVPPSTRSCRNHCPHCLYSIHVDVNPGDRASQCHGVMKPIAIIAHSKKGYQVVHHCERCHAERRNVLRFDDDVQPDSLETAMRIMSTLR